MSYDSSHLVVLLKHSNELYKIKVFETSYFNQQLSIDLGDKDCPKKYIKAANIATNLDGNIFCVTYLEDGLFSVCIFEKSRHIKNVNISELIGIEKLYIRPNDNFPYPMMDACFVKIDLETRTQRSVINSQVFAYAILKEPSTRKSGFQTMISEENLFITLFMNNDNEMKTFVYDFFNHNIIRKPVTTKLRQKPI
jgi:hypothetical protein